MERTEAQVCKTWAGFGWSWHFIGQDVFSFEHVLEESAVRLAL